MNLGLKMIAIEGRNELAYYDGRRTHCDPLRLANSYAYYSAQNLANQTARAAMTFFNVPHGGQSFGLQT